MTQWKSACLNAVQFPVLPIIHIYFKHFKWWHAPVISAFEKPRQEDFQV